MVQTLEEWARVERDADEDIPDSEVDGLATGSCFEQLRECKPGEEIDEMLVLFLPSATGAEADGDRNALAIRRRGIEALAQIQELDAGLAGYVIATTRKLLRWQAMRRTAGLSPSRKL